jgi:hypothetical protein
VQIGRTEEHHRLLEGVIGLGNCSTLRLIRLARSIGVLRLCAFALH